MRKNLFFAAVALVALASCSENDFVGNNSPDTSQENGTEAIQFSLNLKNTTRADIMGGEAANLLGNNFYVIGTKGTEGATKPTENLVFDNYLVHYGINTAGTTESNTANWEYVGVVPGTAPTADYVKLSSLNIQTIKYWDYSTDQYDFHAFSTGSKAAVSSTTPTDNQVGVTTSLYGAGLDVSSSVPTAYTLYIPTVAALKETYITDITEVLKTNYGKEVTLKFKNLGSKVRVALYETIPGYSVKDVKFYASTTSPINHTADGYVAPTGTATLISADTYGFPTKGQIDVSFPHVGVNNSPDAVAPNTAKEDYNKAVATVTPTTASSVKTQTFDALDNFANPEHYEAATNGLSENDLVEYHYIGRSLPNATFAGSSAAQYYQTVFPVSSPAPITLRVDYTLVATDGSGEEIKVYGANAVVPSTYTKWLPNYAYTYIFKISDNTNGWTDEAGTKVGLFPITFDAVVAEATDANAEQKTITTVATPSITTYQQNHNYLAQDEYDNSIGKNVYVQVMNNSGATATLCTDLNETVPGVTTKRSRLYAVTSTGTTISEATVMDALENRTNATITGIPVIGRNGINLAHNTNINPAVTSIVNGADDNPIAVNAGEAAMITIGNLEAGTYAYVYDYTDAEKNVTTIYQPFTPSLYLPIGTKYITKDQLDAITTVTSEGDAVNYSNLYFSKTTNGTGTTTYSYVSVDSKESLPAGLLIFSASSLIEATSNSETGAPNTLSSSAAFAFKLYYRNDGKYAVKVIKVVN